MGDVVEIKFIKCSICNKRQASFLCDMTIGTRVVWCGLYEGVNITLEEAMKYSKQKPPYVLSVSSDID